MCLWLVRKPTVDILNVIPFLRSRNTTETLNIVIHRSQDCKSLIQLDQSFTVHPGVSLLRWLLSAKTRGSVCAYCPGGTGCIPTEMQQKKRATVPTATKPTSLPDPQDHRIPASTCHLFSRGGLVPGQAEEGSDVESNNSLCEESHRPRGRGEMERADAPKPSTPLRNRAPRRPNKPLYIPRAARERLSDQNAAAPAKDKELPCPGSRSCSCSRNSTSSDSCSCSDTTESTRSSSIPHQDALPRMPHSVADAICDGTADNYPSCPQDDKQDGELKLHGDELCAWPLAWDQTMSYFTAMTLEENSKEEEEEIAGVSYSPQKEDISTDPDDLTEEITAHLKEGKDISIDHAHNDYSCFENVWINPDKFGHVIEIYDFPAMFKTDDLLDAFTEYSDGGMKIKWVDNTHALGVFSSESAALHALSIHHPLMKARTLSEGSRKSKGKAIRRAEFIQPVKERPRTDSAVARRMVTRALGLQRGGRAKQY